jgi:spore maturation protein CgeB
MKDIPHFDLHVVQRDKNIADYKERGARDVIKIQTAYEPTIHFPAPEGWSDKDRDRGVSFVGTSYDDRPEFLTRLWSECGFPVVISGDRMWNERLDAEAAKALYTGSELYGRDYREAIWRSKINLSFITHSNQDEFVHKSFEIAACGGFLLAERSAGHMARFREDVEAVFFTGFEECAEKIRRYLFDEAARGRIAKAGRERAVRDGYSNDAQVAKIVERLQTVGRMRRL